MLTNIAIALAKDDLPGLVSDLTSNAINKFEREINGKGPVRTGKRFTLFILNQNMNDIMKILKSLEDSGALIKGITGTVKCEIKKQEDGILGALLAASIVQPVISSAVKGISRRRDRRAGKGYMDANF